MWQKRLENLHIQIDFLTDTNATVIAEVLSYYTQAYYIGKAYL